MDKETLERIEFFHSEIHETMSRAADLLNEIFDESDIVGLGAKIEIGIRLYEGLATICKLHRWAEETYRKQQAAKN